MFYICHFEKNKKASPLFQKSLYIAVSHTIIVGFYFFTGQ